MEIDHKSVWKKLPKLKTTKSVGPDGIHPRVLKETTETIAPILAAIYNKSLNKSHIPAAWKEGLITPLHKKGNKTQPGNYRPISLTSVAGKIMESLIRDQPLSHMMENQLVCDAQHGFVPGRSCMTQLLVTLEKWMDLLDNEDAFDVIYLDIKKALDTVPHCRWMSKLEAYGISGPIKSWIKDFLTGRKQRVSVNHKYSPWSPVTIVAYPNEAFIFVLFINDLPESVSSTVMIFADDTKLFNTVSRYHKQLQEDLDKLLDWSETWQLHFNQGKCKALHFGRNNPKKTYNIGNTTLEVVLEEKDLGVIVDNQLTFHKHIATAVKKANHMLGLIKSTFTCHDVDILPCLYTSLVHPH